MCLVALNGAASTLESHCSACGLSRFIGDIITDKASDAYANIKHCVPNGKHSRHTHDRGAKQPNGVSEHTSGKVQDAADSARPCRTKDPRGSAFGNGCRLNLSRGKRDDELNMFL